MIEIFLKEFLLLNYLNANDVKDILEGKLDEDLAAKLAKEFNTSTAFWINLRNKDEV